MRLYYAQNREDLLIKAFFLDVQKGFYIDVGANDPVIDSVTKIFYDEGWSGINIEPIKRHFKALKKERPRDTNLQIGLGSKDAELEFTEYPEGDGLSTFSASVQKNYKKGEHNFPTDKMRQYSVPVRTLKSVIEEIKPKHVHFIKIDVEGYEYEVVRGYDWETVRPELICIEANHIDKDWRPLIKKSGYEQVFFDGINNYYLAKESLPRKQYFNYADIVFAGNPVYYSAWLEAEHEQKAKFDEQIRQLNHKLRDKEEEVAFLHRQQRDIHFLAKQLAKETQLRLNKRASGVAAQDHLNYEASQALRHIAESPDADKAKLLAEIHSLDKTSIERRRSKLVSKTKPLMWKAAAGTMNTTVKLAKKVKHGR